MDIVFSSAAQLAAAIQAKQVSASEMLDAHLAQINAHNPTLTAIVTLDAERARERARESDAALAHGEVWGPLHGVPFTLKDAHATAFNYTGHPAVVLPWKLDRAGLPIGVQIVGKRWSESRLLAIAAALEDVTGPFQRPPGY